MQKNFDKRFFSNNRKKLYSLLTPDSIVVLFSAEQFPRNGDQYYKYRQNSDTYYYSGLIQEQTIIVLFNDSKNQRVEEFAFITEPDEKTLIWTGHKYSKEEVFEISGITNVEFLIKFDETLKNLLSKTSVIYYSFKSNIRGIKYNDYNIDSWKANLEKANNNLV
ncbi:MAG TPA: aminopeptidase P N-terminal domain-containing protein, partial [Bacteroidales bacterium]|nr:aminopeptidase P N-terminal domain-containing protein [Bacteroidales bacterium]